MMERQIEPDALSRGYLKGVAARALLGMIIKQGRLEAMEQGRWHITLSLEPWQMPLLADFVEGGSGTESGAGSITAG